MTTEDQTQENPPLPPERPEGSQAESKILKVPRKALEEYLERMKGGRGCSYCDTGIYEVPPSPTGGVAGVVATPVPNRGKVGVWFYIATCDKCGDTRFFHAGRAYAAMTSDH